MQMPAPYIIADVIETNATYYTDFFWDMMCALVFDPTQLHHEHLTESASFNHSAILPPETFGLRLR
jgi:hypothetical protein